MFPMLSLGMSIGKKHHALMKAWARVFNVIQIKYSFMKSYGKFKMCFTCATNTYLSFLITDEIPRVLLS